MFEPAEASKGRCKAAQSEDHFTPVEAIKGGAKADLLLICDHASNAIPPHYDNLGLSPADLTRHIAWDIGAAELTRGLAARLGAPALLTRVSRLIIDANRGTDDPTLVMRLSDGRIIPGNARIDAVEIERRRVLYWQPYRAAIATSLEAMIAHGVIPAVVSIHSFTPFWKGTMRPWQAAVLWDTDARLARPLIEALRAEGLCVGDNEPYDGALKGDTLDAEVTRRGLAGCLIEIRQDLLAQISDIAAWTDLLARILAPLLNREDMHVQKYLASRTGRHLDCGSI